MEFIIYEYLNINMLKHSSTHQLIRVLDYDFIFISIKNILCHKGKCHF